jgi:hypothetical protein
MCVWSATVISQRIFAHRYACDTGFMSARTDFRHEVTAKRGSLRRPQAQLSSMLDMGSVANPWD